MRALTLTLFAALALLAAAAGAVGGAAAKLNALTDAGSPTVRLADWLAGPLE